MNLRSPLSLLAIALVAFSVTTAQAAVDVQLNLRYDDPANEAAGGTWDLLAQSGAANGLAGLSVVIDGLTGVTGIDTPGSAITANADAFDAINSVFRFQPIGATEVEIVAGDDLAGALITGVGTGSGAHNVASDDLFFGNQPLHNWDNSSLIASGTFGAARPSFSSVLANEFDTIATDPILAAAIGDTSVRGDSVLTDGLLPGDANRNGNVDITDFGILQPNFGGAGPFGWDDGDFNSSTLVDITDFGLLQPNFGNGATPPAIGGVPEPTTIALAAFGLVALFVRKKS